MSLPTNAKWEVGRVTPVRAAVWQVPDGAHGVTRPTTPFAFVRRLLS